MRLRMFALLGSLALLAILGAPTLAMSVRAHLPTAPWGTRSSPAAPTAPRWHPLWVRAGVSDEQDYLSQMVARHQDAVAAARQLARSPHEQMRAFAASMVATDSAEIAQMQRWLHRWYPDQAAGISYRPLTEDLSALSGDALDRAFLRQMIGEHMVDVMLSQQLLTSRLAVHPAVARLAVRIEGSEHAEMLRMQRWLLDWYGLAWRPGLGMGPQMMGRWP